MKCSVNGFSFLALAYNHEDYIVEHLESIKYLVEHYAANIQISLIINDDFSKDKTVFLINKWLEHNSRIFYSVTKLYNNNNLGTCESILNMLSHVSTPYLKLTACDDVYSNENIFEYSVLPDSVAIRSGIPLSLVKGKLFENKIDTLNILASDIIYSKKPLIDRFKLLSNNNAPNIIYGKIYLENQEVKSFLSNYDVVEDWPIQISIAENYPSAKFDLIKKVFVYYRRTPSSTYVVAKGRFFNDKSHLYKYLICKQSGFFYKLLLKNRLYLFKMGGKYKNKILNFSFYIYVFSLFKSLPLILKARSEFSVDLKRHEAHYLYINNKALEFNESDFFK